MNGLELLKQVKGNPSLQGIHFIMLTARKDEKLNEEAIKAGATDFIVKPGTPEYLKKNRGTHMTIQSSFLVRYVDTFPGLLYFVLFVGEI